jgi:hypothetical protein
MIDKAQLAARLRQSVQGCTLHSHGPVQAWMAIENACEQGHVTHQEIAQIIVEGCTNRIESLEQEGVDAQDPRILKEKTTMEFIKKLLL